MKIKIQGFAGGKNHSWAVVHWHLAREWKKLGHNVHIFSTDGVKYLPKDLKENLIGYTLEPKPGQKKSNPTVGRNPDNNYDMQFSYTAMKNAKRYLSNGGKNRFNMWCYEWSGKNILPQNFATCYRHSDLLLTPSTYAKEGMMMSSGVPEDHVVVVPHGIEVDLFRKNTILNDLPTKKSFKFLFNVTQAHLRKNISGLLDAYGKAFTSNDDVCLILKTKDKKPTAPFEVSVSKEIDKFKKNFKNFPEVKIYDKFLDDISELYRSVDCTVSLSHGEGFNMPLLESIGCGKLVIAPTLGGHTDFINESNALLVKSEMVKANRKSMYWGANPNAKWVLPDVDDAVLKLREAYETASERNKQLKENQEQVFEKYNWNTIAQQVIDLCE